MGLDQGVPGSADRLRRRHDAADRRIHPDGDHVGSPLVASTSGLNADQRAAEVGRVRTALLAVLAGSIAVVGAIYTARTFALNRQTYEHARETTRQSHELDHARLVTERFTRAVDQLGNENLDVRLSGIYALERLARESRDDHGPIMEILTAYVREHAPQPTRAAKAPDEEQEDPAAGSTPPEARANEAAAVRDRPSTDVQAVLTVLRRRRREYDTDQRLDLRHALLAGANLQGANLQRALLDGRTCTDRGWTGRSSTARACNGRICTGRTWEGRTCRRRT